MPHCIKARLRVPHGCLRGRRFADGAADAMIIT
jgi:hypothetical protein